MINFSPPLYHKYMTGRVILENLSANKSCAAMQGAVAEASSNVERRCVLLI
jgi:hypothetical protein